MTCGPDDPDCAEVLGRVYEYLDGELGALDLEKVRAHLEACAPCLQEYDLDVHLKALVRRSCGCDSAPADLRERIMFTIMQARQQYSS
jgi:mycothiol system anti-sigma-R factor